MESLSLAAQKCTYIKIAFLEPLFEKLLDPLITSCEKQGRQPGIPRFCCNLT
jgi:hypothetical protein